MPPLNEFLEMRIIHASLITMWRMVVSCRASQEQPGRWTTTGSAEGAT